MHTLIFCIFLIFCILMLSGPRVLADSQTIRISTDIAPIHSLVKQVVGDRIKVDLIIPPSQSPHDFAMKPSQIRALDEADLIVIVSKGFNPSIGRHLNSLDKSDNVLNLADYAIKHNREHAHLLHDEHTWLNPETAMLWLEEIKEVVSTIDETHRTEYERNAKKAIDHIREWHKSLQEQLTDLDKVQYIVYHDAYRHFAHAFNLAIPHPIALSDARAPGAAKLKHIRSIARQSKCAFSEKQHDDAIVTTISAGFELKRGILDPLGSDVPTGPTLYSELMHSMVKTFKDCLSG